VLFYCVNSNKKASNPTNESIDPLLALGCFCFLFSYSRPSRLFLPWHLLSRYEPDWISDDFWQKQPVEMGRKAAPRRDPLEARERPVHWSHRASRMTDSLQRDVVAGFIKPENYRMVQRCSVYFTVWIIQS